MIIIYFLIGLIASVIGAVAGIGGGVIIKPVLDFLAYDDVGSISILSAATVLAMAVVSLVTLFFSKETEIDLRTASLLATSSMIGGFIGKQIFTLFMDMMENKAIVSFTQSLILTVLMAVILVYSLKKHHLRSFHLQHATFILLIGFSLGIIASFLGIGGGPFNIAILTFLFSMSAKSASANSIFIIFFSQIASLLTTSWTTGFSSFDLDMIWYIVAGGVLGGIIGSALLTKVPNRFIEKVFTITVSLIILINVYNVIKVIPNLV